MFSRSWFGSGSAGMWLLISAVYPTALIAAESDAVRGQVPVPTVEMLKKELEILREQDARHRRMMALLAERIRLLEEAAAQQPATVPPSPPVTPPVTPPVRLWTAAGPAQQRPLNAEGPPQRRNRQLAQASSDADPALGDRKEAAPSAAVETILSEEHAFFGRRFTLEPSITYSRFDRSQLNLNGFLALDTIFLGSISVDEVESDIVNADLVGRANLTNRFQVNGTLPTVYRKSNFQSGGAGGGAATVIEKSVSEQPALGDVSFGMTYRLFPETPSRPDIVVSLTGKAPTGTDPFGIELVTVPGSQGNLSVPEKLPTGNGVWSVSGGVSLLKTFDPLVFFGSTTYFHNFEQSFDDINDAAGDQPGKVRIGDALQFGVGMAVALNERTSVSLSYTQRFVQETETRLDGQADFAQVIGSDANVAVLNTGVTFALNDRTAIVFNVGTGLTPDAADVQFSWRTPFSF